VGVPILVRLDDDVQTELEAQAQSQGVGLETLLGNLATEAARAAKRARIWEDSERLGALYATDPEVKAFYDDWGTPTAIID
jgi:hypothetical protein